MLDGQCIVIAQFLQSSYESLPVDLAQTGNTVTPPAGFPGLRIDLPAEYTIAELAFRQNFGIFGMGVKDFPGIILYCLDIIDTQPVKMGGIEIKSKIFGRNFIEQC